MTPEDEIDMEIAHSTLNEYIARLAHRRAEIEKDIYHARDLQTHLTPEIARRIIKAGKKNGRY